MKPQTIIYTRSFSQNEEADAEDYSYAIHDPTLRRTRNYICPNEKCVTHNKPEIREAGLTKNLMEKIVYVCIPCGHHWSRTV